MFFILLFLVQDLFAFSNARDLVKTKEENSKKTIMNKSISKNNSFVNEPFKEGVLYYRYPHYIKNSTPFLFLKQNQILTKDIQGYSYYYKVFYVKNQVEKVEYYVLQELMETYVYEYISPFEFKVEGYNSYGTNIFSQKYKNNKLVFFRIYDLQKTYRAIKEEENNNFTYLIYNQFPLTKKNIKTIINYNKNYQPLSEIHYINGIIDYKKNYIYDSLFRIKSEKIHFVQKRSYKTISYEYKDGFLIHSKKEYTNDYLFSKSTYNSMGELLLVQNYFPYTKRIQNKIKYQYQKTGERNLEYYDFLDRLYLKEFYNEEDQLIRRIDYPSRLFDISEKKETQYLYLSEKEGELHQVLEDGIIKKKIFKNKDGTNRKIWLLNNDGTEDQIFFFYNKNQQLIKKVYYKNLKELYEKILFKYNKANQIKLMEIYQFKNYKLNVKYSRYYTYYPNGYLKFLKEFKNEQMLKQIKYDFRFRPIEIHHGENGSYQTMIKHTYDDKDCIIESVRYNKVYQIEGYLKHKYNDFNIKIQEDIYDQHKKYLGSILYQYDSDLFLQAKKYYNESGDLYNEEFITKENTEKEVKL